VTYFYIPKAQNHPDCSLVIFHHAGGSADFYSQWLPLFPKTWELIFVNLPGRGRLFNEPLQEDIHKVVSLLSSSLPHFSHKNVHFFGHSMGARIAFELAHALLKKNTFTPRTLLLSSSTSPTGFEKEKEEYSYSDEDVLKRIKNLDGTPDEFFEHEELVKIYLNIFRADFKLCDHWNPHPLRTPLSIPIYFSYGKEEEKQELFEAWGKETNSSYSSKEFDGNHFYFQNKEPEFINYLVECIQKNSR